MSSSEEKKADESDAASWTGDSTSSEEEEETGENNEAQETTTGKASRNSGGVQFGEVRIREHERVMKKRVSDIYAGLEIGWGHQSSRHMTVDDFEDLKIEEHHEKHRNQKHERLKVLTKYGYSAKEVLDLEKKRANLSEQRKLGNRTPSIIQDEPSKKKGLKALLHRHHSPKRARSPKRGFFKRK